MLAETRGLPKSQLLTAQILNRNPEQAPVGEEKFKTRGQLDYEELEGHDDDNYADESGPMSLTIVTREQNEQLIVQDPSQIAEIEDFEAQERMIMQ